MNKKYKKVSIILFLIVAFVFVVILCYLNSQSYLDKNEYVQKFNYKIEMLENHKINELITKPGNKVVSISICNTKNQAIVRSLRGNSTKNTYQNVKKEIQKYIKSHSYNVEWLKVDISEDTKLTSSKELSENLYLLEENSFRNGIILNDKIILTEEELNSNNIINYDDCNLDYEKLEQYLISNGKSEKVSKTDHIETFNTISYFLDEKNEIYEANIDKATSGTRKVEDEKQNITNMINNSFEYLHNMVTDNGKFIYGYKALSNKKITSYNILRHSGSLWSLIVQYDKSLDSDGKIRDKIENSLDYLIKDIKTPKSNLSYVVETKNDEIKLGGNGLATIALCEYIDKFKANDKYLKLAQNLGNGIIEMQQKDGSFVHVLNSTDYTLKNEYRTVYYDGEATFALCKLYGITKNKKYLKAAQKSIQYFIDNNYIMYCDHWIEYALNEATKYVDNNDYYEFALKNVANNLSFIRDKTHTSHINFEMLIQCFEIYERLIDRKINLKYLKEFPLDKFIDTIKYRASFQLNSYMYPEMAMYLKSPSKYCDTFFIRTSSFRIRIDDIQHSLLGYYFYNKNYDKIHKRD